jgi:hypothetical protein
LSKAFIIASPFLSCAYDQIWRKKLISLKANILQLIVRDKLNYVGTEIKILLKWPERNKYDVRRWDGFIWPCIGHNALPPLRAILKITVVLDTDVSVGPWRWMQRSPPQHWYIITKPLVATNPKTFRKQCSKKSHVVMKRLLTLKSKK